MKTRRRRWFREDTVAPWLTLVVIVSVWWGGSTLIRSTADGESADYADNTNASTGSRESERTNESDEYNKSNRDGAGQTQADRANSSYRTDPRESLAPPARSEMTGEPADVPARSASFEPPAGERPVVPVVGIEASSLKSTFDEARGAGSRRHEAMDILAPRGTPVVASVTGRIAKLFTSAAGGLTVYQFDPDERHCYYYAHLDSYAPELTEGQVVERGQIIGFVGTTGNAPPDTPHLHFAIFRLGPDKRWWEGEPVDPINFLRN